MNLEKSKKERRETVGSRIPGSLKEKVKEKAAEMDVPYSLLIEEAIKQYINFDLGFLSKIEKVCDTLKIPKHLFIQNILLSWLADREAYREVLGSEISRLDEFVFTDRGILTGELFFRDMKEAAMDRYKQQKS